MAWEGYHTYAGQEFINVARTEAYATGAPWFRPSGTGSYLGAMLADDAYVSPLVDNAPWADPDQPSSYEFWGLYPLDIAGIEDATVSSTVIESTADGGVAGRVRRGTKTVVYNCLLLAGSDCGADYGVKWLRALLNGSACGPLATQTCNGDDLCYLSCEPSYDVSDGGTGALTELDGGGAGDPPPGYDGGGAGGGAYENLFDGCDALDDCIVDTPGVAPWECLIDFKRSLRKVVFNNGPVVTSKRSTSDGAAVWTVSFTAIAGSPYEFGEEVEVITNFLGTEESIADGVMVFSTPYIFTESACAVPIYTPVYDPLCPAVVVPPSPPSVPLGCYSPPANWFRRKVTIPNTMIPLWSDAVPVIRVNAVDDDVRNLRLRFYADVNGDGLIEDDPCAYCGDIVISYVPEGSTLVFDGSDQVVYVQTSGGIRRRADNLVFKTDGTPFEWPALSCGFAYIVAFDLPQTSTVPTIDVSLFNRVA